MSKMTRGFFKRTIVQFSLMFTFSLIGGAIAGFSFAKNAVASKAQSEDILSRYNDCDYDYLVRNLGEEQIETLKTLHSVEKYVCYSQSNATLKINDENVDVSIISLLDDSKLDMTEYSSKRIISNNNSSNELEMYVYDNFARAYKLKLGDKMKVAGMEFEINRIYRNASAQFLYIPNLNSLLKEKFSEELPVSGAYISCKDKQQFKSDFLDGYKPLALQKKESDFETTEEYNAYLDDFNSKDYSNYYNDKMQNYDQDSIRIKSYSDESLKNSVLSGLLVGGFIFIGSLVYLFANMRKLKIEISNNGRREANIRSLISHLAEVVFSTAIAFVLIFILTQLSNPFIQFNRAIMISAFILLIAIGFVAVSYLVNVVVINKKPKVVNSGTKPKVTSDSEATEENTNREKTK